MSSEAKVERLTVAGLTPAILYAILRLRVDVFVVEQDCPYPELDGRDLEPDALHLLVRGDDAADSDVDSGVEAYLRVLTEPDGSRRVGRVVTAASARGRGLAGALLSDVLAAEGTAYDLVMDAQAHLRDWYGRFGFTPTGPEFLEDGIPHIPMRRTRG